MWEVTTHSNTKNCYSVLLIVDKVLTTSKSDKINGCHFLVTQTEMSTYLHTKKPAQNIQDRALIFFIILDKMGHFCTFNTFYPV